MDSNERERNMPTAPGYYILVKGEWYKTDGLTYRTFANTLHIR